MEDLKAELGFVKIKSKLDKKTGIGSILIQDENDAELTVYRFAQSFIPDEKIQLNDNKWFNEDYCQYTGNVFYVHSDGNIAPCCGFANEKKELFIGTVKDSFATLMKNASENIMVHICYDLGLLKKAKELQKLKILTKGKCNDMCSFCWWMCRKEQ